MRLRFGSATWLEAFMKALAAQPALGEALRGLGRDAAVVVLADPPLWPETVVAWAEQRHGRVADFRLLADEDEVLELSPAYVIRAPYGVFKALLRGADPLQAALTGKVKVEGDLEALVRRARYRQVLDAALAAVPTDLP